MSPDLPDLTPDCSACAAYCCVALAFDNGDRFAIDKPAGTPCPNLDRHHCTIHERLEQQGFTGCIRYQCTGAGQRALALHEGTSWQDDAARLGSQSETFRHLRSLHDLIQLLVTAQALALPPDIEAERQSLLADLCPPEMTPSKAESLATGRLPDTVYRFLTSLAPYASTNPTPKT